MREPTNTERRMMIIGGFDTLEEYLQFLATPTDPALIEKWEEPDYEEEVIEESGIFGREEVDEEEEEFIRSQLEE